MRIQEENKKHIFEGLYWKAEKRVEANEVDAATLAKDAEAYTGSVYDGHTLIYWAVETYAMCIEAHSGARIDARKLQADIEKILEI